LLPCGVRRIQTRQSTRVCECHKLHPAQQQDRWGTILAEIDAEFEKVYSCGSAFCLNQT
jgi:hypothetical protein